MEILKLPFMYVLMFTLCYLKTTVQCVSTPERAPTCRRPSPRPYLRVRAELKGALLKFSCDVNFRLNGVYQVTCNGTTWSDDIPRCEPWKPSTACDFEAADLCGWNQNDLDDEEWIWHTGSTPIKRTGPKHDHTLGSQGTGHYLYFEDSSSDKCEHKAILESPLYPAAWGRRCFSFWYHILGEKDIGRLEVYVRPDGTCCMAGLVPKFTVDHNMGSDWMNQTINVPKQDSPFQIWFVAIRGSGNRSDFAIDDVSLSDCQDLSTTSTMPSTTVMKTSSTTAITSKKQTTRAPNTKLKRQSQQPAELHRP